jgi:RND family efflux transporter MFP subunit
LQIIHRRRPQRSLLLSPIAMHPTRAFAAIASAIVCLATVPAAARAAETAAEIQLQPAQVQALGVQTAAATGGAATADARFPATVQIPSNQQRVVAAALPGLVETLRVSVGDTVRAGQVLAVVRSAQMQELNHDVHVARSNAVLTAGQLARDEQLFKEGLIAKSRLELTRAQFGLAAEQREERELALTQAGGSHQGDGSVMTLTAPIGGVVLERPVAVGQRVDPTTPIYRLASLAPLWLEMQVPAADVQALKLGDEVQVDGHRTGTDAFGKVIAIGRAIDAATQTVLVRAEIKQPPAAMRAGQAVEVQWRQSLAGVRQVPAAAVMEDGGAMVVYLDAGQGRFQIRPVQVVRSAGGMATVRGLPEGSKVVVQGNAALKSLRAAQRP